MMRAIHRAAWLAACLALAGCAGPTALEMPDEAYAVQVGETGKPVGSDPVRIESAAVEGDALVLDVRFGGGCREHEFSLHASGAWMESDPVRTSVLLAHDANGDPCRALLSRELRFDLTPLALAYRSAYGRGGTLVLDLYTPGGHEPASHQVRYTF